MAVNPSPVYVSPRQTLWAFMCEFVEGPPPDDGLPYYIEFQRGFTARIGVRKDRDVIVTTDGDEWAPDSVLFHLGPLAEK